MVLLLQRPCLMIAESGAPARAIRRANPTRPLWPEDPSPSPAACAAALTMPVDRLGRHPEDGRTRIAAALPDLVQGGHGPAGDEHRLALAGLIGFALLDERTAAAVGIALDVGPDEGRGQSERRRPQSRSTSIWAMSTMPRRSRSLGDRGVARMASIASSSSAGGPYG